MAWWAASVGYRYNAELRLDQLTDLAGGETVLGEDGEFLPSTIDLPTSPALRINKEHPAVHTPSAILYNDVLINEDLGVNYAYNQAGQASRRILVAQSDESKQVGRGFGYDRLRRLTGYHDYRDSAFTSSCGTAFVDENGNSCATPGGTEISNENSYAYDLVGNRSDSNAVMSRATGWYAFVATP